MRKIDKTSYFLCNHKLIKMRTFTTKDELRATVIKYFDGTDDAVSIYILQ